MDFAFFAANFGYSLDDYEAMTPRQRRLIIKARETSIVEQTTLICNAVQVGVGNAMRKKGRKAQELWRKKSSADVSIIENYETIKANIMKMQNNITGEVKHG